MSAEISFTWDSRDLDLWRGKSKVEGALVRALRLAGNRALRELGKGSVEAVRARKLMREEYVRRGLPLVFPGRKEAIQDLVWREKVSGEVVPLSRFPMVQTAFGVAVRINVSGSKRVIKSAFIRSMKSGHEGVFQRKGKERLPIKELWTTKLSDVMDDKGLAPALLQGAGVKLQGAFEAALRRELAKLQRKGED
jgi:hypothetical protein